MMARISVLIPCRQHGHYLDAALASVMGQTWPDVEAVVANDGSTDVTADVAERWRRAYPDRVIVLETGGVGQARARRLASDRARGDYWITLDADDLLEPAMAAKCLKVLEAAPDAAAAVADVWMTDVSGRRALHCLKQRSLSGWPAVLEACPIGAWNGVLIRAAVARRVGGLGVEGESGAEDWDFAVRLVRAGLTVAGVGEALARYRQSPDSHSRDPMAPFQAKLAMLDRCRGADPRLQDFGVTQPVLDERAYWRCRNRHLFFAWGLCASGRPASALALAPFFGGSEPDWGGWPTAYAHGVAHGSRGGSLPPQRVPPEVREAVTAALRTAGRPVREVEELIRAMARAAWRRHFHGPRYWWRRWEASRATRRFMSAGGLLPPPASPAG